MRSIHYSIKLPVCFALVWASLTMAVTKLKLVAPQVSAAGPTAAPLFQTQWRFCTPEVRAISSGWIRSTCVWRAAWPDAAK